MSTLPLSKADEPEKGPGPEDPVASERRIGQMIYRALRRVTRELADSTLETMNPSHIVSTIDWYAVSMELMGVSRPLQTVITAAAREEIPKSSLQKATLILDEPMPIEFAIINRLAVEYAEQHAGRLVLELSTKMRETIAALISGSVGGQIPRGALIRLMRAVIPLHSAWAATVEAAFLRIYEEEIAAGRSLERATEKAGRVASVRAERLLQARVKNIARTEAMTAMNEGKFAGWSQQIGDGWLPVDSLKEWIEGRDPCKQCAPLVGQIVPWDEPFSNGMMMPPEHPSCRCTAALLPPDEQFVRIMERQALERQSA